MALPAHERTSAVLEDVADFAGSVLLGDGARLQQVMYNILSNAIKYASSTVTVAARLARVGSSTSRGLFPCFPP